MMKLRVTPEHSSSSSDPGPTLRPGRPQTGLTSGFGYTRSFALFKGVWREDRYQSTVCALSSGAEVWSNLLRIEMRIGGWTSSQMFLSFVWFVPLWWKDGFSLSVQSWNDPLTRVHMKPSRILSSAAERVACLPGLWSPPTLAFHFHRHTRQWWRFPGRGWGLFDDKGVSISNGRKVEVMQLVTCKL